VLLISGCRDNQLSLDGVKNGLFTQRLLETWSNGCFNGNYRELHRQIVDNHAAAANVELVVVHKPAEPCLRSATTLHDLGRRHGRRARANGHRGCRRPPKQMDRRALVITGSLLFPQPVAGNLRYLQAEA
jgi:hypothetical protein